MQFRSDKEVLFCWFVIDGFWTRPICHGWYMSTERNDCEYEVLVTHLHWQDQMHKCISQLWIFTGNFTAQKSLQFVFSFWSKFGLSLFNSTYNTHQDRRYRIIGFTCKWKILGYDTIFDLKALQWNIKNVFPMCAKSLWWTVATLIWSHSQKFNFFMAGVNHRRLC